MLSGFRFDRSGRSLRGRNPWFCRHLHAGFYFLNALDDHFLAGFQARSDHPVRAHARPDLHGANFRLPVGANDGKLIAALTSITARCGTTTASLRVLAVMRARANKPGRNTLPGFLNCRHENRPGRSVHLPVYRKQPGLVGKGLAIREDQVNELGRFSSGIAMPPGCGSLPRDIPLR